MVKDNGPIRIVKADGKSERALLEAMRGRAEENDRAVEESVREILYTVRKGGDAALRAYTERFDHVKLERFAVDPGLPAKAAERLDGALFASLSRAADRIRDFHLRQARQGFVDARADGSLVGQRVLPLARVGVYAPGGTAVYPSSVLMNIIPAKAAGVEQVALVTPPPKNDACFDLLLAAAHLAGADEIYTVGGAQAVAALAYGTESIKKVDKITGPGNIYVATAKRLVYGTVDIDMIAGPSEILVIADDGANPAYVAADLLSQAEHDRLASAVLLCLSEKFAERVAAELEKQLEDLPRQEIARASLSSFGAVIVCEGLEEAAVLSNAIAPEHLELAVREPLSLLGAIRNAGSVFLGDYSPEALGDYMAGPNHILPTGGSARFFSPLSVDSFVKKSSFIMATRASLAGSRQDIERIAAAEGLDAHARSAAIRFAENERRSDE